MVPLVLQAQSVEHLLHVGGPVGAENVKRVPWQISHRRTSLRTEKKPRDSKFKVDVFSAVKSHDARDGSRGSPKSLRQMLDCHTYRDVQLQQKCCLDRLASTQLNRFGYGHFMKSLFIQWCKYLTKKRALVNGYKGAVE